MIGFILICLVTFFRIIPHAPNFTPMGAVAVISGRHYSVKMSLLVTIVSMLVSDFILSLVYGYRFLGYISLFVYAAFVVQALLGRYFRSVKGGSLIAAVSGSLVFFIVTNLAVWLQGTMYPHTLTGLGNCFIAAIPFYRMTLLGDVCWTAALSSLYYLYQRNYLKVLRPVPVI